jgi:hypothetical protein
MPTNLCERGSAMVELMMLMLGAAALIVVVTQKFSKPFSHSEADWIRSAFQIHRHVGHQVCLEDLAKLRTDKPVYFKKGIQICSTP